MLDTRTKTLEQNLTLKLMLLGARIWTTSPEFLASLQFHSIYDLCGCLKALPSSSCHEAVEPAAGLFSLRRSQQYFLQSSVLGCSNTFSAWLLPLFPSASTSLGFILLVDLSFLTQCILLLPCFCPLPLPRLSAFLSQC